MNETPKPVRRYLLLVGIAIGGALIGRLLPGFQMPPLPLETQQQIERIEKNAIETAATVKKIEANYVLVLNALAK